MWSDEWNCRCCSACYFPWDERDQPQTMNVQEVPTVRFDLGAGGGAASSHANGCGAQSTTHTAPQKDEAFDVFETFDRDGDSVSGGDSDPSSS